MDSGFARHLRTLVASLAVVACLGVPASAPADPAFVSVIGALGSASGQFNLPQALAIDGADDIFVADENSNRVDGFDTAGTFIKAWGFNVNGGGVAETCTAACIAGTSGVAAGQLDFPVGIATDASGNLYVGENSARVSEFATATGGFVKAFGWGVDTGAAAFETCTTASGCGFFGGSGDGAGEFRNPFALAIDGSGNLFVGDHSAARVDEFTSGGAFTKAWGWGVATGASAFETCTATCQSAVTGSGAGQFQTVSGVAVDASGNVFALDDTRHRVSLFSSGGAFTKAFGWGVLDGQLKFETCTTVCVSGQGGDGAGQVNQPFGAVVDASGNLWIADKNNHRIDEFDPAGNFRLAFGWGVATGAAAFEVCRTTCHFGLNGNGSGQFSSPGDVALDSIGDLYVADTGNNRLQRFAVGHNVDVSLAGAGTGSVTGAGVACPGTCSTSAANGTLVSLAATPTTGSTFDGWSGACTGTGTCDLTLNGDKSATASFSVSPTGGGGGGGTPAPPPPASPAITSSAPPSAPAAAAPPVPVEYKSGNAQPVTGTVLVELPGTTKFIPITDVTTIPVGSIVDVRHGRVHITIDIGGGKTASADFFEGVFKFLQPRVKKGKPIARLVLVGGSFNGCPRVRGAGAAKKPKSIRHLWGEGSGPFRTEGRFASAAIRGTTWDTDDRCDGTLVKVTKGAVTVNDFGTKKNVVVKAGHQYLARAFR